MNVLRMKELLDKMLLSLSDADKQELVEMLAEYLMVEDLVIIDPPLETLPLTGYLYEASSEYAGKYYVMPPKFMNGDIKSITVGPEVYTHKLNWQGSELWYGDPGVGVITIVLNDGTVYASKALNKPQDTPNKDKLDFIGVHNGGLSSWNDYRPHAQFPRKFYLTVVGCFSRKLIEYDGERWDELTNKQLVIRPSEVGHGGTAVMTRCAATEAYIEY